MHSIALPRGVPADLHLSLRAKAGPSNIQPKQHQRGDIEAVEYGGDGGVEMGQQEDEEVMSVAPQDVDQTLLSQGSAQPSARGAKNTHSQRVRESQEKAKSEQHVVLDPQGKPRYRSGLSDDEPSPPRYVSVGSFRGAFHV